MDAIGFCGHVTQSEGLEKEGLFSMLESVGQGDDREIGHDAIASL